jgi:hypothetical protein
MLLCDTFRARGHPNITAAHTTTLMVTREPGLTERGDCIIAVSAEKGLGDLDWRIKKVIRSRQARIKLALAADNLAFEVSGMGHPELTLSHPTEIVARKSSFICDRTLMIGADGAACNISEQLLRLIKGEEKIIEITIAVEI